jgi:alkaline phosphatase
VKIEKALTYWFALGCLSFIGCTAPAAPRRVILVVADGMGPAQAALGLSYAGEVEERRLNLEGLMARGRTGYTLLSTDDSVVVDSAASASQMATGVTVLSESLSVEPRGERMETILEWAEEQGLATGLVTNTRLSHATPAAFAVHHVSRYVSEEDIANELVSGSEVEVMLGGGARAFVPQGTRVADALPGISPELDGLSNRTDDRNLVEEARENGYAIASDRSSLKRAVRGSGAVLGLFSSSHFPYVVDRRNEGWDGVPGLDEMTEAALEVLEKSEEGFFLMVEGGRIDHAGHHNDAGTMLQEILDLDEAVGVAMRFQSRHPETLLIVTADHATGGFSLTYSLPPEPLERSLASGDAYQQRWYYPGTEELRILGRQKASFERILDRAGMDVERLIDEVEQGTGLLLTRDEASGVLVRNDEGHAKTHDFRKFYADPADSPMCLLGRALARQTSVVWSTGGHTSELVLTFGTGPGAEKLRGIYPDTHIYSVMREALEAKEAGGQ